MAKKSKVARQAQREKLVGKFAAKRAELRKQSVDMKLSLEERMEARAALAQLPRDSAGCRLKTAARSLVAHTVTSVVWVSAATWSVNSVTKACCLV